MSYKPRTVANLGLSWLFRAAMPSSGISYRPAVVKIGVNSVCNARCRTCDVGTGDSETMYYKNMDFDKKELDFEKVSRFISSLESFKPKVVIGTTEPLLYRRLFDLVRRVKAGRMECVIQTNGLRLEKVADEIIESGLDALGVSLDGVKEVHDRIRGVPGIYEKALSGLKTIHEIKKARGLSRPSLRINCVISEYNQGNLVDFVNALAATGISFQMLSFYHQNFITEAMANEHNRLWGDKLPVTPVNCSDSDPMRVNCAALSEQIRKIEEAEFPFPINWVPRLQGEREVEIFYREHFKTVGMASCVVPWHMVSLNPDGSVNVISRCFNINLGNAFEQDILDIFNNKEMIEFRKLLNKEKLFPACKRCCAIL